MSKFVHLHAHSHYSLLDGLPKISDFVSHIKKLGQSAVALTDHGSMYGTVEFYKEALSQNIKPIIGVETYLAPRSRKDKQHKIDDQNNHLVLLAQNVTGYKNLLQLVTLAHLEGFYYKPRIDWEILSAHSQGLVGLSACLKGNIPQALMSGDKKKAREFLEKYLSVFGENNFYLEVQAHPELTEQVAVNRQLAELSKEMGVAMVATNDAHYLRAEDADAQDILVCIQTGKKVMETDRLDMRAINSSLKTEAEMKKDLPDFLDAIAATSKLADKLNAEIELETRSFPSYPTPEGETPEAYLRLLTENGLTKKYPNGVSDDVRARIEYELKVIMSKGYASYFLVVSDFVNWARANDIFTTTRGSAAGSLVSYLLGITSINPLEYKLPFERFLNPNRPSPPDIDMDFADNRRDEVIDYVTTKYGANRVAQIVTFGTMMARAAVRDVGRALGYPYSMCDRVAKMIPFGHQGFAMTIKRAMVENPDLKKIYDEDPEVAKLLNLAQKVEGCARHASVHAAGVIISPTPLTDFMPLQMDGDGGHIITQYDMTSCENVGLVKMDFLGIRNLSIMGSAVEIIEKTKAVKIDIDNIPLNDAPTFKLLAEGNTMGLFQLSSSGMTRYLTELKPTKLSDIMAMVALYRPGPINSLPEFIKRKHNPQAITYLDPRLKDILQDSYGIIAYQDDVLLAAIALAGYTWEEADKLRKAMGKKIPREMARQKEKFISGCITGGLPEAKAIALWLLIEPFAAYGFNKAHAASYGMVAYQTAYLKANFPTEYMAALMTAESDDLEKISAAVAECEKMGIKVLPPDINESLTGFTVLSDESIRFGLCAMKNLGNQIAQAMITERKQNGKFTSLENFLTRTANTSANKKSLESLIKAGALDSLHSNRLQLLDSIDGLTSYHRSHNIAQNSNQSSLFSDAHIKAAPLKLEPAPPTDKADALTWEKEVLGLYVSGHPFTNFAKKLDGYIVLARDIVTQSDRKSVIIAGLVTQTKTVTTKKGELMMFATLADLSGDQEVIIFPETFQTTKDIWQSDKIVIASGQISHRNGEIKVIIQKVFDIHDLKEIEGVLAKLNGLAPTTTYPNKDKIISLSSDINPTTMEDLKKLLNKYPGDKQVIFKLSTPEGTKQVTTPFRVANSPNLDAAIDKLIS